MKHSKINVLFIRLFWLAIFIKSSECRPAPDEIEDTLNETPTAELGSFIKIVPEDKIESIVPGLQLKTAKNLPNKELGKIAKNLTISNLKRIFDAIPQSAIDSFFENQDRSHGSSKKSSEGSIFENLSSGQIGDLITAVPSSELGPQIKNLPSSELISVLRAIPHSGVQKVLSSVPSSNLRAILGQLPSDEQDKILQSESSLGSVPDEKLAEVAARLGSGLIYLAKFFPASKDGHLLANLPRKDAGNFVKGLSPGNRAKFANTLPKAIPKDLPTGETDENAEEYSNSSDTNENAEEYSNSNNGIGGLIENIVNGLTGSSNGLLG